MTDTGKAARKGLVWGALGRGAPGSWLLLRAKDGRILAASETCGGALKSAHAIWSDIDASDREADGVRILRDADGGVVGAVTPKDAIDRVRGALSDLQRDARPTARPSAEPEVIRVSNESSQKTSRAKRVSKTAAVSTTTSIRTARTESTAATLHIVAPVTLRRQIEDLRAHIEAATMIRPTTTDVVKRALELGLAAMSARLSPAGSGDSASD